MTIVFKISDNLKNKVIEYYKDLRRKKTPPYAVFQAVEEDTIVTLYESGKLMFQGTSADIDANIWIDLEKKLNKRIINIDGTEEGTCESIKQRGISSLNQLTNYIYWLLERYIRLVNI